MFPKLTPQPPIPYPFNSLRNIRLLFDFLNETVSEQLKLSRTQQEGCLWYPRPHEWAEVTTELVPRLNISMKVKKEVVPQNCTSSWS